jgi:hypothetical protein
VIVVRWLVGVVRAVVRRIIDALSQFLQDLMIIALLAAVGVLLAWLPWLEEQRAWLRDLVP